MSNNQIESIESLANLTKLNRLNLKNNKLSDLKVCAFFKELQHLKISFNSLNTSFKNEYLPPKNTIRIYLDVSQIPLFSHIVNKRVFMVKNGKRYTFLYSLYLILENEPETVDCLLTLDFIKRNVHFNLYFDHQVERFQRECHHLALPWLLHFYLILFEFKFLFIFSSIFYLVLLFCLFCCYVQVL